jgi:hypothetical protein
MTDRGRGQPAYYKNKEEMQDRVDLYFFACEYNKNPNDNLLANLPDAAKKIVKEVDNRRPTVTGLALALGFTSRQALLHYQATDNFFDTVTKAKARIEAYVEEQLFEGHANGAKFSLTNNFKDWEDKKSQDINQRYVDKKGEDLSTNDLKIIEEYNQKILNRGNEHDG